MTMSKAEARTIREGLGLTPPLLAEKAGVGVNAILFAERTRYSRTPGPAHQKALRECAQTFQNALGRCAEEARREGVIRRQNTRAGFEEDVPELAGWPERSMGIFYAELLSSTGLPVEYAPDIQTPKKG